MTHNKIDPKNLKVPENELGFKTARSSGPGGQNVNKLDTKVTVIFKPAESNYLCENQKHIIIKKLIGRIHKDGTIAISSQKYRSQFANKNHVIEKLNQLLIKTLTPKQRRIKTRPTKSSIEKRLASKKIHGRLKMQRSKKHTPDE